jgi:hypothetical protein
MKDKRGLYYFPNPADRKVRMYVREVDGAIQFRIWNQDHPMVWDKHGWVDHAAIVRAAEMYREMGRTADPLAMYDVEVAERLIKEERRVQKG